MARHDNRIRSKPHEHDRGVGHHRWVKVEEVTRPQGTRHTKASNKQGKETKNFSKDKKKKFLAHLLVVLGRRGGRESGDQRKNSAHYHMQ